MGLIGVLGCLCTLDWSIDNKESVYEGGGNLSDLDETYSVIFFIMSP